MIEKYLFQIIISLLMALGGVFMIFFKKSITDLEKKTDEKVKTELCEQIHRGDEKYMEEKFENINTSLSRIENLIVNGNS